MAAVAEQEAEAISKRSKAVLQAARERGTKLGGRRVSSERFAEIQTSARQKRTERVAKQRAQLLPIITQIQTAGATTLRAIAAVLSAREIEAPKGGQWSTVQVQRVQQCEEGKGK